MSPGGCVVELIGAELHDVGLITCVGCAIVHRERSNTSAHDYDHG